jgi:hypothetical protein
VGKRRRQAEPQARESPRAALQRHPGRARRPDRPDQPRPSLRGRARRWRDAVAELAALQAEYVEWLETLPDTLQDTTTADALRAIADLDLSELEAIDPPKGFGRD